MCYFNLEGADPLNRVIKGNWSDDYMRFVEGQESPAIFHKWTALSVLASTLGRNIYLDFGYYNVYPNLYVILVADSARFRKTVAMGIGMEILGALDDSPNVLSQKITPEAIIQELEATGMMRGPDGLARNSECTIFSPELAVFLGEDSFSNGTAALLTTFYDCPDKWAYETKSRGKERLHHVVVNFSGASTIAWLRRCVPHDAVGGGFFSRFLSVFAQEGGKLIPRPKVTADMLQIKDNLIHDLNIIRSIKGECSLTAKACDFFDSWYLDWMGSLTGDAGYRPKKHIAVLKIAMLLSISRSSSLDVTVDDLTGAIQLLDQIEPSMDDLRQAMDISAKGKEAEGVLEHIRKSGNYGVSRTKLLRLCWRSIDAEGLDKIISTLTEAGLINPMMIKRKGRMGRRYKTTKSGDDQPQKGGD